jgi:hypothetical protein
VFSIRPVVFCFAALLPLSVIAEINRLQLGAHMDIQAVTFRVYSSRATRLEVDLFKQASLSSTLSLKRHSKAPPLAVERRGAEFLLGLAFSGTV